MACGARIRLTDGRRRPGQPSVFAGSRALWPQMQGGAAGAAQYGRAASQYKLWRTLVYTRRAALRPPARSAHKSLEPTRLKYSGLVGPRRISLAESRG